MTLKRVTRIPKTTIHAGLEARLLVEYWRLMHAGDIVTYADMHELTGLDVQRRRDILHTACHIMETQYQMLFKPITSVGYQCLGNLEKVRYIEQKTTYIHRRAHRNLQRLTTVDMAALTSTDQLRYLAQQTMLAAAHLYTHETTRDALMAQNTPPPLTPFDRNAHARLAGLWGPTGA